MFSKSQINEPGPKQTGVAHVSEAGAASAATEETFSQEINVPAPKPQPSPSFLAADLTIIGDLSSTGDIQLEGTVKGNVRAHLLTVGQQAIVEGEIIADDVVITGQVIGTVRGLKVRLTSTAQVKGDIIRKVIAIESGAHFEGSVRRVENPLS
ncbi:MAG: polymer-forming cytoskeletal protein [Rhodobacteraceae bacterium]|jgi:cytoskeletal protein CcmA (bactofilin family)|nr:polymer-forming cytoskeletal protein [Paracoccaceae bacterium]